MDFRDIMHISNVCLAVPCPKTGSATNKNGAIATKNTDFGKPANRLHTPSANFQTYEEEEIAFIVLNLFFDNLIRNLDSSAL